MALRDGRCKTVQPQKTARRLFDKIKLDTKNSIGPTIPLWGTSQRTESLEWDLNIRLHRDICHLRAEAIQVPVARPRQTTCGVTCLGGSWLFNEHLTCHNTDEPGDMPVRQASHTKTNTAMALPGCPGRISLRTLRRWPWPKGTGELNE